MARLNTGERKRRFQTLTEIYRKYTCHFFREVINDGVSAQFPLGSGVFVEMDNNYFLLTAAHVIENRQRDIFVANDTKIPINFDDNWFLNPFPKSCARGYDPIDLAILRLNETDRTEILQRYDFLPYTEIGINHNLVDTFEAYVGIGFPGEWNECNSEDEHVSIPLIFSTNIFPAATYNELGCNTSQNIIVHYDQSNVFNYTTGESIIGPDPRGISGCGLWYVEERNGNTNKKLVGILTKWNSEKNCWIATRIDIFTEIIRRICGLNIEKSNLITCNIRLP